MQHEFDSATAIRPTGVSGSFDAEVQPGWDINGNANGGYLLAIAGRAMRDASGKPDPVSVTAHFLAPGLAGPVTLSTSAVKTGRQLVTMTGSIQRGDRELLRVLGSFGDVAATTGGYSHNTLVPPDLPPIDECLEHPGRDGPVNVALVEQLHQWFRPEHAPFQPGPKSGVAVIEGWVAFADGRPFDTLSLLLVADGFPPPVFHLDMPSGWVPTIELTAHVRAIPVPGPLKCRFHSEVVQNGFLQEDGEVWDSAGTLVAQSRQLALLPRG
jgi:acyl-CoA thioesterase